MMKHKLPKVGIIVIIILAAQYTMAQDTTQTDEMHNRDILYGSFCHQNLPGTWHVNYWGINLELALSQSVGFSGSLYFGKASNRLGYVHVPVPGILITAAMASIFGRIEDISILKLLMIESIHFYIPAGKDFYASPYINILGADFTGGSEEDNPGHMLLSSGIGCQVKSIRTEHFAIALDICFKYFICDKPLFGSGNQFGFTAGIHFGYIF